MGIQGCLTSVGFPLLLLTDTSLGFFFSLFCSVLGLCLLGFPFHQVSFLPLSLCFPVSHSRLVLLSPLCRAFSFLCVLLTLPPLGLCSGKPSQSPARGRGLALHPSLALVSSLFTVVYLSDVCPLATAALKGGTVSALSASSMCLVIFILKNKCLNEFPVSENPHQNVAVPLFLLAECFVAYLSLLYPLSF